MPSEILLAAAIAAVFVVPALMLPIIPPEGAFVGAALTAMPGVAALLLARRRHGGSLATIARAHLQKSAAPHPASVR